MGQLFDQLTGVRSQSGTGGTTTSSTQFRPEDLNLINQGQQNLLSQTQAAQQLGSNLQQQVGPAPTLGVNYGQLQGVTAYDPRTASIDPAGRAMISQGTQAMNAQLGTQIRGLNQQFGGQPGIAQALGRQAAITSRLNLNPANFQAMQDSVNRGQTAFQNTMNLAQQQSALQEASNRAALQQQEAQRAQRMERFGYGENAARAGSNLLTSLLGSGTALGTQSRTVGEQTTGKQGGFLQNAGIK